MNGFKKIDTTKSLCPICLKKVDANVLLKNQKVFLFKKCSQHGKFLFPHIWDNIKLYMYMKKLSSEIHYNNPNVGIIIDVTSKCNLKCSFCFGVNSYRKKNTDLPQSEITGINKIIKEQGFESPSIYLFGGEPTLRKDIFHLIRKLKKLGLETCLFTNGIKLSDSRYVHLLKKSGTNHVILQFDGCNDEVYKKIRGTKLLSKKIAAMDNLKKDKIVTSLFVPLVKNVNEEEVGNILNLPLEYGNIKNIFFSTISFEGKYQDNIKQISNYERLALVEKVTGANEEDFFVSTLFDHKISKFIETLTKKPVKHISPTCDLVCYFYSSSFNPIPLTRIVDLSYMIRWLDKCMKFRSNRYSNISREAIKLFFESGKVCKYRAYFLYLALNSLFLMFSSLFKQHIENSFNRIFRVFITQFQDRYNLDQKSFKGCNIYSVFDDGKLRSFCEKIILKV